MIPLCLLVAQVGPAYPFPRAIIVSPKQTYEGRVVRTFTDPSDELELVMTDVATGEVQQVDMATGRNSWLWKFKSESQRVDGHLLPSDPKAQPFQFSEVRSKAGAQFSFETGLDEGGTQELISRFYTLPLPGEPVSIGDSWEFRDGRTFPYTFRGRILGSENGLYKVRTYFQSTESPKFTANGTTWVGFNGVPAKIELTASPIELPGGEGQKATLTLSLTLGRK